MPERKVWVLDTETKGTGATMVPLQQVQRNHEAKGDPMWVPPKRRPREPAPPPPPKAPRRFRVVDVATRRTLADGVDAKTMLAVLGEVRSMYDVSVYVFEPAGDRWRLLSLAEQEAVWKRRTPAE